MTSTGSNLACLWACVFADRELRVFVYDPCQRAVATATRLIRANPAMARTRCGLADVAADVGRITEPDSSTYHGQAAVQN
jgi:hypothetical protein